MMSWHYQKNLGRYFNNPAEITPMVETMSWVAEVFFWGMIAAMVLLVFGARKNSGLLYWLLILVPIGICHCSSLLSTRPGYGGMDTT